MSVERFLLWAALAAVSFAAPAMAQGFAGLGTDAEGYSRVEPGHPFAFPLDHGAHPGYRIEWWYLTANLEDRSGQSLGIQWTLFRNALAPLPEREGWQNRQLWMAHAAVTTEDVHLSAEAFARGGIGQAGVRAAPFSAWLDDWMLAETQETTMGLGRLQATASGDRFSYDLQMTTTAAPVLHGDQGYSVKSEEGQASFYYSQPFFRIEGEVTIDGESRSVAGEAWLDREWSSQPLAADQEGWDWFSLHLASGEKVMLFGLRGRNDKVFNAGTWIEADGTATALASSDIALQPLATSAVAGRDVPTRWRVQIRSRGLDLVATALNAQSWMDTAFSYWEGPIHLDGSHDGVGYLEMTGYR
ncbi:lipocalin-like domain-containing protein [Pararhizobium haloflavum]|uniref:lipocalin-like domain-containing protein n=1 Tax=Pararhizobium haloflavum TaxID=2037914 RepID=UPI000C18E1AD|nr:lipocalin-like domain-containing protein [Pararhizobium haloflavum]